MEDEVQAAEQRKEKGRQLFYRCAKQWLNPQQLKQTRALLLLGVQTRELVHLDKIFARNQIVCVEYDFDRYLDLVGQNLGIAIYYQDLAEFLNWAAGDEQRFSLMDLDIYGTYRNRIGHCLSRLLALAYKQPNHIIGFTSSIGRDGRLLCEALASLIILAWLDQSGRQIELCQALGQRVLRLSAAEVFASETNLVLRDMMWLRDLIEHCLAVSAQVTGQAKLFTTYRGFSRHLVKQVMAQIMHQSDTEICLTRVLKMVRHEVNQTSTYQRLAKQLKSVICLKQLNQFLYHSVHPWLVKRYYVQFQPAEPAISLASLTQQFLTSYGQSQFQVVLRSGTSLNLRSCSNLTHLPAISLEVPKVLVRFQPDACPVVLDAKYLTTRKEATVPKVKSRHQSVLLKSDGKLNKYGSSVVRQMLEDGHDCQTVADEVGCKVTSVRAVLAHMHRSD